MQPIPDVHTILGAIPWVVVDGIALRAYMPERMTLDVDILIHERNSSAAREAFVAAGYIRFNASAGETTPVTAHPLMSTDRRRIRVARHLARRNRVEAGSG